MKNTVLISGYRMGAAKIITQLRAIFLDRMAYLFQRLQRICADSTLKGQCGAPSALIEPGSIQCRLKIHIEINQIADQQGICCDNTL